MKIAPVGRPPGGGEPRLASRRPSLGPRLLQHLAHGGPELRGLGYEVQLRVGPASTRGAAGVAAGALSFSEANEWVESREEKPDAVFFGSP